MIENSIDYYVKFSWHSCAACNFRSFVTRFRPISIWRTCQYRCLSEISSRCTYSIFLLQHSALCGWSSDAHC